MTKQEEIREGMRDILAEDWIVRHITHENPPPGKDCGEECGVGLEDQIAAANPIISPMRSGGKKHKRCMDCWEEYIDSLIGRILKKQDSHGCVLKVERECPYCDDGVQINIMVNDAYIACPHCNGLKKYTATESLI